VGIFDAGGKAMDLNMVFADFTRKVRKVRERCYDADL
jgi:hypothetical protein